jgi:hypothetical protein
MDMSPSHGTLAPAFDFFSSLLTCAATMSSSTMRSSNERLLTDERPSTRRKTRHVAPSRAPRWCACPPLGGRATIEWPHGGALRRPRTERCNPPSSGLDPRPGEQILARRWFIVYPHGGSVPTDLRDPYGGEHRLLWRFISRIPTTSDPFDGSEVSPKP